MSISEGNVGMQIVLVIQIFGRIVLTSGLRIVHFGVVTIEDTDSGYY